MPDSAALYEFTMLISGPPPSRESPVAKTEVQSNWLGPGTIVLRGLIPHREENVVKLPHRTSQYHGCDLSQPNLDHDTNQTYRTVLELAIVQVEDNAGSKIMPISSLDDFVIYLWLLRLCRLHWRAGLIPRRISRHGLEA